MHLNTLKYINHFISSKIARFTYKTQGPLFLNMALTYRCNSKCQMCNIWKTYKKNSQKATQELRIQDYERFFNDNKKYLKDLLQIAITGGEPFLREDLVELVKIIHKLYPRAFIDLSTNGFLSKRITSTVEKFFKENPILRLQVSVSLDGIGEVHDEIRGVKGAFEKVRTTCELLRELKDRFSNLEITLSFTILESNYKEISKVYQFAERYGVRFTLRPAQVSEIYYLNPNLKVSFPNDMIQFVEMKAKEISLGYRSFFIRHIKNYLRNPKKQIVPCYSLFYSMFTDPFGDVYPCTFINSSVGNIKDAEFFERIWNSNKIKSMRKEIKNNRCPNCWTECESNKSIYLDGTSLLFWYIFERHLR
ncbi:MAG: radical SAM/SPASM domain-containing protein [Candidatus Methanofastidiosia archaeon]